MLPWILTLLFIFAEILKMIDGDLIYTWKRRIIRESALALTVMRQIAVQVLADELVDLALAPELTGELLGGDGGLSCRLHVLILIIVGLGIGFLKFYI